jgi:hypothetical protein
MIIIVAFICLLLLIFVIYDTNEGFNANINADIDLLDIKNPRTMKPWLITSTDFAHIISNVEQLIIDRVIKSGKLCQNINDNDKLREHQLSLTCHSSLDKIENEIIFDVTNFVIRHIKKKLNININPYQVIDDLKTHSDIIESVLYPLANSGRYTVNGVQYFSEISLINKVRGNHMISDVIYTTLTKRGIDVMIDDERNIID